MAVVPLASLARVDDASPSATAQVVSAGDPAGAERIAAFSPSAGRASRSSPAAPVRQPADDRAVPTTTTSTTSTTAAPVTTTTAKPKPKVVVTTTSTTAKPKVVVTTTTTTAKPKPPPTTTTTAAPRPAPTNRQDGGASFHDYANASTCAHRSLPFGTVLTVTNLANGKQATCTVNDRGPYVDGRIIDLSRTTFGQLAPVSSGVIQVSIEW
jgi:rare lipoprotein A (peptidoglycan hydrolase)